MECYFDNFLKERNPFDHMYNEDHNFDFLSFIYSFLYITYTIFHKRLFDADQLN